MAYLTEEKRWTAVRDRDRQAVGHFIYAVRTTGVYCRPGCGSRLPLRENLAFFDSAITAELAGFRACLRCKPADSITDSTDARLLQVYRQLKQDANVSINTLAQSFGWSPTYLSRQFRRTFSVTPTQLRTLQRQQRFRESLLAGQDPAAAAASAGYSETGQGYREAKRHLGMTPVEYRNGAAGKKLYRAIVRCRLGWLAVAMSELGVCAVTLGDRKQDLSDQLDQYFPSANWQTTGTAFDDWVRQLIHWLEQPHTNLEIPLDLRGTLFQMQVWKALQAIPLGQTMTNSDLATKMGRPGAARAVSRACATNPIAILIPCHRVIGKDGDLRGYRWGLKRKEQLLSLERQASEAAD